VALKKVAGIGKDFHNLDLRGDLGDWAGHVEENWMGGDYRFEKGASELFNNSTPSPLDDVLELPCSFSFPLSAHHPEKGD
jgi:hypothetical protein